MEKDNEMYYPLPIGLTIKTSKIHGLGLFSTAIFKEGFNFGCSHVLSSEYQHGLIRTPLGGFINHSKDSNCETIDIGDKRFLIAKIDIMPEEELTLTYTTYKVATRL